MNRFQRWLLWSQAFWLRLARVTPVEVGRSGDGLVPFSTAGTDLDPRWDDLLRDLNDAREAWRTNPLARRLISLVSPFVCGDGLTLSRERRELGRFR